ncbi:Fpg/Nei family DNA glycosylase [soil metagenome]
MPEGDTIHRAARRIDVVLAGKEMALADAPSPRSPIHGKAKRLEGSTLERVEARGKHLIAHFSCDLAVHSHLGMNGRWFIAADGRMPYGKPWLVFASGRAIAAQSGGKLLRLVTESRLRNDPGLAQLGPDPLGQGFDIEAAGERLRRMGAGLEIGDALLDQRIIAGIGNAIRNEALFRVGISPWRQVEDLTSDQIERIVRENERVMQISMTEGKRPRAIYRANRRGCPTCGGPISAQGQGDANRTAYWCPACQA